LLALVIASAVLALFAQTPPPAPSPSPKESPPASADYDLRWGVKIPMRDKVELNATLYLPKTGGGSLPRTPVIFTLTPYISDSYHARAAYFASHGYAFALVDVRGRGNSGREIAFGDLPGFIGVFEILHDNQDQDRHFLFDGPLRLAFFGLHLNSTDGDTCFALDLSGPRLVRLSPNWAAPIPLPGEATFLTFTENRYVPVPGSKKTANCSYMERWGEKLNKTRYAREKSAARCYGASMYRPGLSPLTITMRRSSD
jgi:hypothetical protein